MNDPRTVLTGEPFLWWRYWLPGAAMALGVMLVFFVGAAALFTVMGGAAWGFATVFGVPMAAGILLGWGVRGTVAGLIVLALVIVVTLGASMTVGAMGTICVLMMGGIIWLPAGIGWAAGFLARDLVKGKGKWRQWRHLPVVLVIASCAVMVIAQRVFWTRCAVETVTTSAEFDADPETVWTSIVFYEDAVVLRGSPPLLLRLGLPRPVSSSGALNAAGDSRTCLYSYGQLVKRVTDFDPGRRLAFDVTEQMFLQHDARLLGGAIELGDAGDGRTRVTLTTTYEPLIRPRFCWRMGERATIRTLHGVVLDAMRERAESRDPRRVRSVPVIDPVIGPAIGTVIGPVMELPKSSVVAAPTGGGS